MPEEKSLTVLQRQKLTKPTPEDAFSEFLIGETKNNALNFIAWLRENKLTPRWDGIFRWKVSYKSKYICYIALLWPTSNGIWEIKPNRLFFWEYSKYITDDKLKQFALDMVQLPGCNMDNRKWCGRMRNMEFLGEKFDEVCGCWPFKVKNLDSAALERLKELVLMSRDIIADINAASKK